MERNSVCGLWCGSLSGFYQKKEREREQVNLPDVRKTTHGVGEGCWHVAPSLVLWLGHLLPPPACRVESRSGPHGTEPRHVLSPATLQICRLLASPSPFRGLTPALLHSSVSASRSLPETLWPHGSLHITPSGCL